MSLHRVTPFQALAAFALVTLTFNVVGAQSSVASRPVPDRDYRLFVGLNIEVSQGDQYALIEGYVNNRVRTDLSPNLVSLRKVDDMRFIYAPKLSRNSLTVKNLSAKQIASTAKAARNAMRNQQALQDFQTHQTAAMEGELNELMANPAGTDAELLQAQVSHKQNEITNFSNIADKFTDQQALTEDINNRSKTAQAGVPTALLITAKVSAPTLVTDAYIVGVARISTEESVSQDVVFFDRVPRLDQKLRQIRIVKEGLPGEFEVLDVKLHIYRNGQELVTDKSEKQFALTRDEAYEYLALERVSQNRGKSLAPEPAWSLAPAELFASAKSDAFDYPMTVQVDEKGNVTSIDPNIILPQNVAELVTKLPFFPGIEDGVAIASTAQVNLASFFR